MSYILRWISIMYKRNIYRKSREYKIERQCSRMERKWEQNANT